MCIRDSSYAGLALIWFMIPLFWFMGIHGPSVVKPALNAALFGHITTNLATDVYKRQMLTLPLCKHRATGRLKRLRVRNRRFAGTGPTGSRLFLCHKMAT